MVARIALAEDVQLRYATHRKVDLFMGDLKVATVTPLDGR